MSVRTRRDQTCTWCGRPVADSGTGRKRRYCRQSCRQRAYEQRSAMKETSIPDDAVILTAEEASAAADRAFEVRCAAEDVSTAVTEGADIPELHRLCAELLTKARDAERLR
ncbi:hypothetical protein CH294_21805 [Rhodococcus sp. 14-2483-1-1]|uniref:hypothetical protein n=1 Tax=Nocardiaceae TaxID=85025 RepID=UPI00050C9ADF|nr:MULTISPECIES: hypothetical protein [Rhodococcus]OZC44523.1 hypothetical protein CH286_21620 [Rhodococcus sp. WWJCD1]OZE74308.1 hypothetical protein CH305_21800 [Rhodococcus sp. 15-649-2-2]OZF30913.1 hypothetical protein CH294_21805 [Rhodococcus sp. 14-2483-1-1]QII01327.1 hypothetical protein BH92_16950 [Rhodococcus fascians A21d2]